MNELFNSFEEILNEHGYALYDLEFVKKSNILSVLIERTDGENINIDDCVKVSEILNRYLDSHEFYDEAYTLDVSSPGIMRPLKTENHYQQQIGNEIEINLYQKDPKLNTKKVIGILEEVDEEEIVIDGNHLSFKQITKANVTF